MASSKSSRRRKLNSSASKPKRRPGNYLGRAEEVAFKKRLRRVRGSRSKNRMVKTLGLGPSQWTGYETGITKPNLVTLAKLRRVEKVDLNWLVVGR